MDPPAPQVFPSFMDTPSKKETIKPLICSIRLNLNVICLCFARLKDRLVNDLWITLQVEGLIPSKSVLLHSSHKNQQIRTGSFLGTALCYNHFSIAWPRVWPDQSKCRFSAERHVHQTIFVNLQCINKCSMSSSSTLHRWQNPNRTIPFFLMHPK